MESVETSPLLSSIATGPICTAMRYATTHTTRGVPVSHLDAAIVCAASRSTQRIKHAHIQHVPDVMPQIQTAAGGAP